MTKILITVLITSLFSVISSCKKGDGDPFLSLKSRASRLAGEWTWTSSEYELSAFSNFNGINHTSSVISTYNGSTETYIESSTNNGVTSSDTISENFTVSWTINKDNTYKIEYASAEGNMTQEGIWSFYGKNKEEELKNKEAVSFITTKETWSAEGMSSSDNYKTLSGRVFRIEALKNKELTLKFSESTTSENSSYSYTQTINLTQ